MPTKGLKDAIARLRANCDAFADRFYFTANIWKGLHYALGLPAVILAAAASATALEASSTLAAAFGAAAALLAAATTFLKPAERSAQFLDAARGFRRLEAEGISRYVDTAWPSDEDPAPEAAITGFKHLLADVQAINEKSPPVPGWTNVVWRKQAGRRKHKGNWAEIESLFDGLPPPAPKSRPE